MQRRNDTGAQRNNAWESRWPPKQMFDVVSTELTKYMEREDDDKMNKLLYRMKSLDRQLVDITCGSDFVKAFGDEIAGILMVYHIATNGTLRKRVNEHIKKNKDKKDSASIDVLL
jgi:hypothetical protein